MASLPAYDNFEAGQDFPDLSQHNNWMSKCLTKEIYEKLRKRTTPSGFSLDQLIQTGQCETFILLGYEYIFVE